jgi:predicted extracellular nuclease
MSFRTILLLMLSAGFVLILFTWSTGHKESKQAGLIAFYNVENLFDTLDDPHKSDNDFLPASALKWNTEKYKNKQQHLAQVISDFDKEGLAILGLAEVENKQVVEELLKTPTLSTKHYRCILEESKDPRGIDVALVYSPAFKPLFHKTLRPCKQQDCLESRDILAVKGLLKGDTVWVYVNHWPSRRAGVEESNDKRMLLSSILKHAVDSVSTSSPSCKIIVMGDFNDTPTDASIRNLTKTQLLFNPFETLSAANVGSIKYKKEWLIYDQILLSPNWKQKDKKSNLMYQSNTAAVYHPAFLHYKKMLANGPFRSYQGKKYYGGYSDHFPVYLPYND